VTEGSTSVRGNHAFNAGGEFISNGIHGIFALSSAAIGKFATIQSGSEANSAVTV